MSFGIEIRPSKADPTRYEFVVKGKSGQILATSGRTYGSALAATQGASALAKAAIIKPKVVG